MMDSFKTKPTTNDFPNIFRPIGDWFRKILRIRPDGIACPQRASVEKLILNQNEITIGKVSTVEIQTIAFDVNNGVLIYKYEVSGGKIIGQGTKVIWDLSGVEAGTYKITASVDDGCGFCGKTQTKLITVKECPDCK